MDFSENDIVAHWGEFDEECELDLKQNYNAAKKPKLEDIVQNEYVAEPRRSTLKIKNPLVTQTIEVMKQTEMLQSLIDTYSNKSGTSNYLVNPCQMIPEVDFPPENVADLVSESKFQKPIWFIPTLDTPFTRGQPQPQPRITTYISKAVFRKVVCGLLRVAGFTDTSESALILFGDAVEHFMENLIEKFHGTDPVEGAEERDLQVAHVEKGYYEMTSCTLTQIHNYYKHNLIARNRHEIAEFNNARNEYEKLMKESQSMQKSAFPENDFLNILEMPAESNESKSINVNDMLQELGSSNSGSTGNAMCSNTTILNLLDNHSNSLNTANAKNNYTTNFE